MKTSKLTSAPVPSLDHFADARRSACNAIHGFARATMALSLLTGEEVEDGSIESLRAALTCLDGARHDAVEALEELKAAQREADAAMLRALRRA